MRIAALVLSLIALFVMLACGGGGSSSVGGVTITGRVIWLPTLGVPDPPATVQAGTGSVPTETSDGSFSVRAPIGSTSVLVLYQPPGGGLVSFRFDFSSATEDVDVGDLVIGPEKVTVTGRTVSAADDSAIQGALVVFAGRIATSNSSGIFSLQEVAYDSNNLSAFFSLEGQVQAQGFFPQVFSPTSAAVGNVVSLDDVVMAPDSGDQPPGTPYTIFGTLSPADKAEGTVVTLLRNGLAVRQFTVGADRQYGFWVGPGDYVLQFSNPTNGTSSPDQSVSLANSTQTARRDATLQ